jgi:hypothetical protein
MSRKGGTIEAELVSVTADTVTLVTPDTKQIKLKIEDLSLGDRQHLVEFGGADAAIITGGKPGLVEKEARLDASKYKRVEGGLTFTEGLTETFELLETPHFLVASIGKIRPQGIAETAERLWHGMAFQHMNFRQDWGTKRSLILLVEERSAYASLGKWYADSVAASGNQDGAREIKTSWEKTGSMTIRIPDAMTTKYNIEARAKVFNITDATKFRKDLEPFPTHSIAGFLLEKQLGGVSSYGAEGYFAILTGHAYFKEISLAGKSETNLLAISGTGRDEISSKQGFKDGSSWARTLRSLVRSGKVAVNLATMLRWKPEDLTPERLVLIYSFAYYMESDSKRLAAFAKMVRRIESSNQIPAPEEIAKIFGFETVAALDADWATFIKEGDFK